MNGKKRWIELGKDLLIGLLAVSAAVLLYFSPLIQGSGLLDLLPHGGTDSTAGSAPPQALSAAAIPLRMTVGTDLGLYGAQYDQEAVDALFDAAAPLLGAALESASLPGTLPETAEGPGRLSWQGLLSGTHIYFGYAEPVPLAVLYRWLKPAGAGCALEGSARHILLAALPGGSLALCWQDQTGGWFLCDTGLDPSLHMAPILESVTPNSACFAFQDEELASVVVPYTLIDGQEPRVPVYSSVCPVSLSDDPQVSQLLEALSFSDLNRALGSDGSVIYVDGEDTVRFYSNGLVRYHAAHGRYGAGGGLAGAAEAAWKLAAAVAPLCGEARLYLVSAQEQDGAYTVAFGYSLNGSTVHLLEQGWCAQFTVRDGAVTDFTFYLRAYTSAGREALLLPAKSAAAILDGLTDDRKELVVQYLDTGETETEPRWIGC